MTKQLTHQEKLIEVLQSGCFTIIYWDSSVASIYKGIWDKDREFIKDEYKKMNKSLIFETSEGNGYCPNIVSLLAVALGGKTDSI